MNIKWVMQPQRERIQGPLQQNVLKECIPLRALGQKCQRNDKESSLSASNT